MGTGGGGSSSPKMQAHGLSRMSSRPMDSSQPCRVDELEMVWVPIALSHSKQPSESLLAWIVRRQTFARISADLKSSKKWKLECFFYFLLFVRFFLRQERWRRRRQQRQWRRRRQRRWWYQFSAFQLKCVFLNGKLWMEKMGLQFFISFPPLLIFAICPREKFPRKKSLSLVLSYFELCGKLGSGSNPAAVKELTC